MKSLFPLLFFGSFSLLYGMNGDISHLTTALHSAAEHGDLRACQSLIKCFALNS